MGRTWTRRKKTSSRNVNDGIRANNSNPFSDLDESVGGDNKNYDAPRAADETTKFERTKGSYAPPRIPRPPSYDSTVVSVTEKGGKSGKDKYAGMADDQSSVVPIPKPAAMKTVSESKEYRSSTRRQRSDPSLAISVSETTREEESTVEYSHSPNHSVTSGEYDESVYSKDIDRGEEEKRSSFEYSYAGLDDATQDTDAEYYYVKQKYGFLSIGLSALQLLVLTVMLALCGVAPLDVNPMIGPYPDVLSEWGGKNAYFIVEKLQLWRLVTPIFLHAGVIHLFCNVAVQLETGAFFEREWGSLRWIVVYIISSIGAMLASCISRPDTISVGSSGALMGLFGAKLSEFLVYAFFDTETKRNRDHGETIRNEQLGGVLCSVAIVSCFSFIPFVDWAGHLGGFAAGFTVGMTIFAGCIRSAAFQFLWGLSGVVLAVFGFGFAGSYLFEEVEIDEDLADVCNYFRRIFAEGYDCTCLGW